VSNSWRTYLVEARDGERVIWRANIEALSLDLLLVSGGLPPLLKSIRQPYTELRITLDPSQNRKC
jgi:hypothetical protein